MVFYLSQNPYRGINAHLNSRLQNTPEGWLEFHSFHVIHIAETLNTTLPPHYVVSAEKSFQIRAFDAEDQIEVRRKVRPDATIFERSSSSRSKAMFSLVATEPTLTLSADEALDDETNYLTAVSIRTLNDDSEMGKVVAWLELLSATNKPGGTGALQYNQKRIATISGGLVLIELDYLHQSRPVMARLPAYVDHEAGAYPYWITLTDPRPTPHEGKLNVFGFRVDDPMPIIDIPLLNEEHVTVDFGAIYQHTFISNRMFSYRADYDVLPDQFETYHAGDQARIRECMRRAKSDSETG